MLWIAWRSDVMARILALSNLYPPHHYGGYELGCFDVMARWRDKGHEIEVLASDVRVPGVHEPVGGEPGVHRRLRLYWDDHKIANPSRLERLRIEWHNQHVLRDVLDAFAPDV